MTRVKHILEQIIFKYNGWVKGKFTLPYVSMAAGSTEVRATKMNHNTSTYGVGGKQQGGSHLMYPNV